MQISCINYYDSSHMKPLIYKEFSLNGVNINTVFPNLYKPDLSKFHIM